MWTRTGLCAPPGPIASTSSTSIRTGLVESCARPSRARRRGPTRSQIAAARGISLHTVRTYVRRIYEKLQVDTIAEAVAVAVRSGLS